jgi:hypothetical protein
VQSITSSSSYASLNVNPVMCNKVTRTRLEVSQRLSPSALISDPYVLASTILDGYAGTICRPSSIFFTFPYL